MFGKYKTDIKGEVRNPPKYNLSNNCRHTVNNFDQEIDIKKFKRILNLISYDLHHYGCGFFRIINQRSELTTFTVREANNTLEFECDDKKDIFGKYGNGCIRYDLKKCKIDFSMNSISIWPNKDRNYANWLSFYNFDDDYKESEKYMNSLPRDYEARMKCSRCGTLMNKTYIIPGIYFIVEMWSLSSPFNAPRCPNKKCGYKSFSDINFAFENKIYRIKTNRIVTEKSLEKKYAKELNIYRDLLRKEKIKRNIKKKTA